MRESAAASLLGLRVQIPPESIDIRHLSALCVVRYRFPRRGRFLVQSSPTECGVTDCDRDGSCLDNEEALVH
jgi:hypothetical protein